MENMAVCDVISLLLAQLGGINYFMCNAIYRAGIVWNCILVFKRQMKFEWAILRINRATNHTAAVLQLLPSEEEYRGLAFWNESWYLHNNFAVGLQYCIMISGENYPSTTRFWTNRKITTRKKLQKNTAVETQNPFQRLTRGKFNIRNHFRKARSSCGRWKEQIVETHLGGENVWSELGKISRRLSC